MEEKELQTIGEAEEAEAGKAHFVAEYRRLGKEEITTDLFSDFIRHQEVTKCWRRVRGKWRIQEAPFVDDWGEEEYKILVECLKNTVETGGFVMGAFNEEGKLKGFVSVESEIFGQYKEYLDLSSIHVSEDMRGHGIGKALFEKAKEWALGQGAKKLYISAHSAVETQSFYRAMGCVETLEYSARHVEKEPSDCQLECVVDKEYAKRREQGKKIFVKRPWKEYLGVAGVFAVAALLGAIVYIVLMFLGNGKLENLRVSELDSIRVKSCAEGAEEPEVVLSKEQMEEAVRLFGELKYGDKIPEKYAEEEKTYTTYTMELKDGKTKVVILGEMYIQIDDDIYVFQNKRSLGEKLEAFEDSLQ